MRLFCFQAAESGNIKEFERLYVSDPSRLRIQDPKGRTATHQAAAKNRVNILQLIAHYGGGNRVESKTTIY